MPLVSGVRRTASAPMLPHGGSRLNASKPEASPKTRCPKHYFLISQSFHIPPGAGKYAPHGLPHEGGPTQHNTTRNTTIESPFKQLQPAAASKAQSKTYDHKTCFQQKSWPLDADRTPNVRDGTSHRDNPTKNTNNVPLQTREHAWAGISGTPRTAGLEGHSTSRGAEP